MYVLVYTCRYVESGDQTEILQAGYWPSYNVPFYEDVFDKLGYSTAVGAYGTEFSYQLCPRAKIFRRDQGKVHDHFLFVSSKVSYCIIF